MDYSLKNLFFTGIWGALLSITVFISGCGSHNDPAEAAVTGIQSEKQAAPPEIIPASAEDINSYIRNSKSKVILLNNWATWCVPCVEEFPGLMKLYNNYKNRGFEIAFVTMDFDDNLEDVSAFLAEQGVDFSTFIKTGKDEDYINGIHSEWDGAIPATFIYETGGELRSFIEGERSYEDFEKEVVRLLDNS